MKRNALIATVLGALALTAGFQTVYAETAPPETTQVVCPSTTAKAYEIDPATPLSTYNWDIDNGTEGTDWSIDTKTGTAVNVIWTTAGDYTFWSQETNQYNCIGPKTTITVTVSPAPVVDPVSNNICSATQKVAGTTVDVVNLELPQAKNAATVGKWDITSVDLNGVTPAAGNATIPYKTADKDYIKNDAYTNSTTAPVNVVYHVTPYAGECAGDEFTVTVTVYPEVKAPVIKF